MASRKLLNAGSADLTDCEVLQMVLQPTVQPGTAIRMSQALLHKFRTFGGVVKASANELRAVAEVNEAGARALQIVQVAVFHMLRQTASTKPILSTEVGIKNYLIAKLQHERVEAFFVLYLDAGCRLIGDEVLWRGTINQVLVYPREIIRRCLDLDAVAIVIAHNHPSGSLRPSYEDERITRAIVDAAAVFDITVMDHVIVGHGECRSFRSAGMI